MFRRTKASIIILGVVMTLLGLLMFIFPVRTTVFFTLCVGWILIFAGVATFVGYFRTPEGARSGVDIALGIVEALLGIAIILWPGISIFEIYLFLGAMIFVNGIYDCVEAFSIRHVDGARWGLWLCLGIITALFGLMVLISPFSMAEAAMIVAGVALVFDGITEIIYGVRM